MHRIRERRRSLNLTMKELAKMVGVSEGAISHYETGRREPDPDMLKKIAYVLGVSVDYLLGVDDQDFAETTDPSPQRTEQRRSEAHDKRKEGHELLDKISSESYQAMLTLLRNMPEKKG